MSAFLATVLVPFATAFAQDPGLERCVQYLAYEFNDREGVPGLQICVRKDGVELVSVARGVADEARGSAVTLDTRFPIGSLSRLFTSAGVLQLVERGEVAFDDDVVKVVPGLPQLSQTVRVRHLLEGTAGIAPWARLFEAAKLEPRPDLDRARVLALFEKAPFEFAPGSDYAPNGAAWSLLPLVLERSWGIDFARGVGPHFLAPLALAHTGLCTNAAPEVGLAGDCDSVAHSHDCEVQLALAPAWIAPTLCSTAPDLARFLELLGGGKVVDEASTALFFTPARRADKRTTNHGVAFDLDRLAGHPRAWHSGGLGGWRARVAWYPDDRVAIAVLANCASANVDGLENELARMVLGEPPSRRLDVPVSKAEVARFAGNYQLATVRVRVFERSDRLVWQDAEGERALAWQGRGTFVDLGDGAFAVHFDLDGDTAAGLTRARGSDSERGRRLP